MASYLLINTMSIDLTLKCISILSSSVQNIFGIVDKFKGHSNDNNSVYIKLKKLDIENDLILINTLLSEINVEKNHSKSLSLCLERLKECVLEIENELKIIDYRVNYNNSLWLFKSVRTYGFENRIKALEVLKENLDNRKNNLFEIIKITNLILN